MDLRIRSGYIFPALVTIPAVLIWAVAAIGVFSDRFLFQEMGIPVFVLLVPLLSFAIFVAFVFIAPNSKEWKAAAVITGIPLLMMVLLQLFFFVIGYKG